jgi:hypothetical protein
VNWRDLFDSGGLTLLRQETPQFVMGLDPATDRDTAAAILARRIRGKRYDVLIIDDPVRPPPTQAWGMRREALCFHLSTASPQVNLAGLGFVALCHGCGQMVRAYRSADTVRDDRLLHQATGTAHWNGTTWVYPEPPPSLARRVADMLFGPWRTT